MARMESHLRIELMPGTKLSQFKDFIANNGDHKLLILTNNINRIMTNK